MTSENNKSRNTSYSSTSLGQNEKSESLILLLTSRNKKTSYLAEEYTRLENEEESIKKMAEKDQALFELADEELKNKSAELCKKYPLYPDIV